MERAENVRQRCLLRRFFSKYHVLVISTVTLVFVCGPQHLYGLVLDCQGLQNVSPPVFFVAIQMIMQPSLVDGEEGIGKQYTRRIFTAGALALSLGVILAGVSEMAFREKNFLFSLLYGALAGTGAFLMTSLLRKVLERVFGRRDSHLIEVLQSASLALSQLLLPLLLAHFRTVYGGEMTILLMGSLLLHTLPLGLVLSHSQRHLLTHNLVRYQSVTMNDLKTPQNGMRRWGHMTGINNEDEEADDPPMKKVTNQGVEILDTIPEEDEGSGKSSIEITEIKLENPQRISPRKFEFFLEYWRESRRILTELFVNPFRSVFRRQTLLPGVILKACDVFIYTLMVSGLPSFAAGATFRLSFVESGILLALMALPALLVTLVSVCMEDLLREKAKHWHISGGICKLLGCIVITSSRTIFFLRMGVLLLGVGQGVSTILQERVLKENVQEDDWSHTRGHISAVSGYLVLIIGFFTNRLLENLHIGTIFLIASLFYSAAIFLFSLTNYF